MSAPESLAAQPLQPLLDWAGGELAARGISVLGAGEEVRRRDWTLLARIPTDAGPMWAKASARAFAHEGPLLVALHELAPGSVLKPLAVHRDNGWLLGPDGGDTLRSGPLDRELALDGAMTPPRPPDWAAVMRSYATLQHTLTTHADPLRATGTPYLPPARLIEVYDRFADRMPGLGPAIAAAAAELDEFGRISLEHNDLYPGHVFRSSATFFDWGDALITHPFLSLRTDRDPQREAYFDTWRELASVTDREIALGRRLAPLTSLHSWLSIDTSPGRPAARFDPFITELAELLRANFA